MSVWLLYESYDDGRTYESEYSCNLEKIVDSEEKAKQWIFNRVVDECKTRIANIERDLEENGLPVKSEQGFNYLMGDLYFYDCQLNSYAYGESEYSIVDGPERWHYYYEEREVE